MKHFKNRAAAVLLAIMLLTFTSLSASAQFARGEKSVGPKVGYVSTNESAAAGLVFQYTFSKHLRIAPEVGCVFKHQKKDAFTLDFNFHTPFTFTGDKAALYPLAGLNYSSWNTSIPQQLEEDIDDVSTRTSRFGFNLGAGFELRCTRTFKFGIEAKYTFIKRFHGANVAVLACYVF